MVAQRRRESIGTDIGIGSTMRRAGSWNGSKIVKGKTRRSRINEIRPGNEVRNTIELRHGEKRVLKVNIACAGPRTWTIETVITTVTTTDDADTETLRRGQLISSIPQVLCSLSDKNALEQK